jgi:hypothetical protein
MMQRTTFIFLLTVVTVADGFAPVSHHRVSFDTQRSSSTILGLAANNEDVTTFREEAESLLAKARQLRSEVETPGEEQASTTKPESTPLVSKWSVASSEDESASGPGYRLYIDIGREEGTWMDPRWGASGKRMELSLDVEFSKEPANETQADKLVSDNMFGQKSSPFVLKSAGVARLRQGFDTMACHGGAYRVDTSGNRHTVRFYVTSDGKEEASYGDVSIPTGGLYFSLPCFGGTVSQLSAKEGIVTVRQMGWNTGWRREESRIVGVFSAKPIGEARKRDGF